MKRYSLLQKAVGAAGVTVVLLHFMLRTTSPKVVFLPFLLCAVSLLGESLSLLCGKPKGAAVFHTLFAAGFFLFWFGFLAVAAYLALRDRQYGLLAFSLPFWLVGVRLAKRSFFRKDLEKATPDAGALSFRVVVSGALVVAALLAGAALLLLGVRRHEAGLLLAGAFFLLGASAFVLAFLTLNGQFDRWKMDILGLYMGVVLILSGAGTVLWKCVELRSLTQALRAFGPWLLVPLLMIAGGVLAVIRNLHNKRS